MKKYYVWKCIEEDGTILQEGGYCEDIREAFEAAIEGWAEGTKDVHVREGTLEEEREYFYGVASHRVVPIGAFVRIKPYETIKKNATSVTEDYDGESAMYNFYMDFCESFVKDEMEEYCNQVFVIHSQEFDTRFQIARIGADKPEPYWFLEEWVDFISEEEAKSSL